MTPPPEACDDYLADCPDCALNISVNPDDVRRDGRQGPVVELDTDTIDGVNCAECGATVKVHAVVVSQLAVSDAGSQTSLPGGGPR